MFFPEPKDSAQPPALAGRPEAVRDLVAGGWRFDDKKSAVGKWRRRLVLKQSAPWLRRDRENSALREERIDRGEENRTSQVHTPGNGGCPESARSAAARSAERRIASRYGARAGRNPVCMCGGRWRDSAGVIAGGVSHRAGSAGVV